MTFSTVRVLLVDHRADDERLLTTELERAGYMVGSRRVDDLQALRSVLAEAAWDLLIVDGAAPMLALLPAPGLDIPLIVVAEEFDEAEAVEIMRAGARDVVSRRNLNRLVLVIQRELRAADVRRQRSRADQALRESEERYRVLVESSPEPIAVHSGGVLVYANPAAARLVGAPDPAVLIGKPVLDFVHPEDRPLVVERIRRTQGDQRLAEPAEERFIRLDGSVIHVETTALPTTFEGRPATQVVVRDVTAHKRAEAELRASRDQLEAIIGGMADGVVVQDASGRFLYANDAAARLAGFDTAEEYLHATAAEISARLDVVGADGQPFDYALLPGRRAMRGERAPEMVVQFRRRDTGETRWSVTRARVVQGADGQPLAISIFHDLTDRVRAERRLAFMAEAGALLGMSLDEAKTLSAITDLAVRSLADWAVVFLVDESGESVHSSALAHRDPERLPLTRELIERYSPRPGPHSILWRVLRQNSAELTREISDATLGGVAQDDEHLRMLRGLRLASALHVPLRARDHTLGALALFTTTDSGRHLGPEELAVVEEIGRRAALAVDNARLYAQAREAIRARDEFLGLASHELRNPVAGISGAIQLLERIRQRGELDSERLERYIGAIGRTASHLAQLTEDLLDVARLRQGRLPLRVREMDLADLVRAAAARQQARSEQPPFQLELVCDPCPIVADADRLEQVVSNLLDNAAKYSDQAEPVDIRLAPEGDGVLLTVRDRGIGLPAGMAERIFEPFGRAPNATQRNIPGLGLGLYICRQIVERHGGRLWADSPGENQGATLHLWLPRQAIDQASERSTDSVG